MNDWSEVWLREAAGWRAVKEGKALVAAGRVEAATLDADTCRGSVRDGKTMRRVVVRRGSRHEVEVRCGCPENRATGAICAHAAAIVLGAIDASSRAGRGAGPCGTSASEPASPPSAIRLELSPQWLEELGRGRLTVRVRPDTERAGDASDAALVTWLGKRGAATGGGPRLIQIGASDLSEWLEIWAAHRSVHLHDGRRIEIASTWKALPVDCGEPVEGVLEMRAVMDSGAVLRIGPSLALWEPATLTLYRPHAAPAGWSTAQWLALGSGQSVQLPMETVLDLMTAAVPLIEPVAGSWLAACRITTVDPQPVLWLEGDVTRLEARLAFVYGGEEVRPASAAAVVGPQEQGPATLLSIAGGTIELSNPAAEAHAGKILEGAGFVVLGDPGCYRLTGRDKVVGFLAGTLEQLRTAWQVRESNAWRNAIRNIRVVRPAFEVVASGNDWFDCHIDLRTSTGEVLPSDQIARLLRASNRTIQSSDGNEWRISEEDGEWLEGTLRDLEVRQDCGVFRIPTESAPHLESLRNNSDNHLVIRHLQEINLGENDAHLTAGLDHLAKQLRPYQRRGVAWLLDRLGRHGGALLADDMGLGKTIQTIALIKFWARVEGRSGPALVVCPTSLLGNWRDEWARFAPELKGVILHGPGRDSLFGELDGVDWAVTTYGSLVRDRALHLRQEYRLVVLDEASLVRNADSEASRCVTKLRARSRLALTGTPVENRLTDLWALFRFIRPGYLGDRNSFKQAYEDACGAGGIAATAAMRRLRDRVGPLMLRRTKSEVATELPPKVEILDWCELSPAQRACYAGLQREGARIADEAGRAVGSNSARFKVLTALLRLRQTCCDLRLLGLDSSPKGEPWTVEDRSAKLARLLERVREAVEGDHRVLVFSQFARMLGHIRELLDADGTPACLLDGSTRDRAAEVARFRSVDGPPVFLISLKAGGYGLNLPEADTVIHYDPWWNPAAEAQASDRAHRIGQTRPVTIYKLLTRGTVEEKVLRLQERKRDLLVKSLGQVDEDGQNLPGGIEDRDLVQLLQ